MLNKAVDFSRQYETILVYNIYWQPILQELDKVMASEL
jgi:hypothetical protein